MLAVRCKGAALPVHSVDTSGALRWMVAVVVVYTTDAAVHAADAGECKPCDVCSEADKQLTYSRCRCQAVQADNMQLVNQINVLSATADP
jgi:hypothetical protein